MATTKADKKAADKEPAKKAAKGAGDEAKAPKKAATKKAAKDEGGHGGEIDKTPKVTPKDPTTKKGGNSALQQPLQPSEDLAAIVGSGTLARGEVVSRVWEYIRKHNLQNPEDKREILADDKLKKVFGKDRATMFEMNKYLAQHLK